jgi:hypothetical protein
MKIKKDPKRSVQPLGSHLLNMYRMPFCTVRCFHDHFGERRVRVHVAGNLSGSQLHQVRQGQFGQQFGHFGSDHVRTQDFAEFLVHHQLDEDGILAQTPRLAMG